MKRRDSRRSGAAKAATWLVGLATLPFLVGCQSSPRGPCNVLLITVDTLRADRLRPYGYQNTDTPNLARLAADSVLFENAFTDVTWTVPALASVMTGTYPTAHGVRTWEDRLGTDHVTLAELLKSRGYRTAAIVGSYALDRRFGLDQGFDQYDDAMNKPMRFSGKAGTADWERLAPSAGEAAVWQLRRTHNDAYRSDDEVAERAIAWLAAHDDTPFFLWVHFFGPHEKGLQDDVPPAQSAAVTRQKISEYDPDVVFADQQVGRLLARLAADSRRANTVVIFHSDHGQSLNEHGLFGHGLDLYDTTAHVPLIIRLPGNRRAGQRVPWLARNLDIFTTVLRLAGVEAPPGVPSRDLFSTDGNPPAELYLETYHPLGLSARDLAMDGRTLRVGTVLRGVRTRDWKLISQQLELTHPQEGMERLAPALVSAKRIDRLYHLRQDPAERLNLAPAQPGRLHELLGALAGFVAQEASWHGGAGSLDERAKERLRALGYLR